MSVNLETPEGLPKTRKARKAATRRTLLGAASQCFAERGYVDTQIGDIAKTAGVAHGTFYVHFANKEALLEELLEQFNQGLLERLTALQADAPGGALGQGALDGRVRQVASTFLAYWSEGRDFVRAYAQKAALGTSVESLRDGINPQMVGFLTQALTVATATLALPPHRIELVTHGLLAAWMRIGLQALFNDAISLAEAEDTLVMMTVAVFRTLREPAEPAGA